MTHAQLMSEYYAAREAQESRAESYALGYDTELTEFYRDVEPRVTFKSFLVEMASAS